MAIQMVVLATRSLMQLPMQVRAEATAAARREVDSQVKALEKGREELRALQDQLSQSQHSNTKQAALLASQAADLDARAAKMAKQEVRLADKHWLLEHRAGTARAMSSACCCQAAAFTPWSGL